MKRVRYNLLNVLTVENASTETTNTVVRHKKAEKERDKKKKKLVSVSDSIGTGGCSLYLFFQILNRRDDPVNSFIPLPV